MSEQDIERRWVGRVSIVMLGILTCGNYNGMLGSEYYHNLETSLIKALVEVLAMVGAYLILRKDPFLHGNSNS